MLKDDSEDEEEMVNQEINGYYTQPINLEGSIRHFNEIRTAFIPYDTLTEQQVELRSKQLKQGDFWLIKGIQV